MNYFYEMLSLNGKVSSTRFVYFAINVLAIIVILCCCFVMIVETLKPEKVSFNYFSGLAEIILACSGLVAFAGATKVFTDKYDNISNQGNVNQDFSDNENPVQNDTKIV